MAKSGCQVFWTLAAVILVALMAIIHFNGIFVAILNGIAMGIGCMTLLLLIEAGLNTVQETEEFFDIRADPENAAATLMKMRSGVTIQFPSL